MVIDCDADHKYCVAKIGFDFMKIMRKKYIVFIILNKFLIKTSQDV